MRIAVYTIARDEVSEVAGWEAATRDADYRLVLDTGSADGTDRLLKAAGVNVFHATFRPWRFDDAFNAALTMVPADIDVCFRVDMDERPRTGWRTAVERVWSNINILWHEYHHSPSKCYYSDRIHSRYGFRWSGPTHEGPSWRDAGSVFQSATSDSIVVDHFPKSKSRPDNLPLLKESVTENRSDAHRTFLYTHALLGAGHLEEGLNELQRYISLGGQGDRLAFLWRCAAVIDEPNSLSHLEEAHKVQRCASNYIALAECYLRSQEWGSCYRACQDALYLLRCNPKRILDWTDDARLRGPLIYTLASTSAWNLWDFEAAYVHAAEAARLAPTDEVVLGNLTKTRLKIRGEAADEACTLL